MRIFDNPNLNFMKWRWHALILSVLVIGAGFATVISRGGLPLGVDFSGGTVLQLKFAQPPDQNAIRAALSGEAVVQTFGDSKNNEVLVRLPIMKGTEQGASLTEEKERVQATLRAANVGEFTVEKTDIVGPVIGEDLKKKGISATLLSLAGILAYIWFRFRLTFAVGAIAATLHDVLVTLAFLTWFGYDLSLNVVAALLTITGYSVNDTIVIFDRVRENQRSKSREPLIDLVNRSVNQTLSRTLITAGTTFLAVVGLYLFGGEVLEGLAFTLLVGIITGTYSTVFIASAIAIVLSPKQGAAPASASRKS